MKTRGHNTAYGKVGAYFVERSPCGYFRIRADPGLDEYMLSTELDELIALLQRARKEPR